MLSEKQGIKQVSYSIDEGSIIDFLIATLQQIRPIFVT